LGHASSVIRKHYAVLKKVLPTVPLPSSNTRTGRKREVTTRMTESLKIYVARNPFKMARKRKEVYGWSDISVQRIQEIHQDQLKLLMRAAKMPMPTKPMVKKSLVFCRKYRHQIADQWRKVNVF
jgi:hypothetical protein